MPRHVAFLRAINVGGHTVTMDRLRALFEELRLRNVETFIASGNVLFDTTTRDIAALEQKIETRLERSLGFEVVTFVREMAALPAVLANHPFDIANDSGHTLSVGFLKLPIDGGALERMQRIGTEHDQFHLHDREAYWLCRTRLSDSRLLGGALQRALGAPTTFRNVTTIQRLAAKLASPG